MEQNVDIIVHTRMIQIPNIQVLGVRLDRMILEVDFIILWPDTPALFLFIMVLRLRKELGVYWLAEEYILSFPVRETNRDTVFSKVLSQSVWICT